MGREQYRLPPYFMLEALSQVEVKLPNLLREGIESWESLDIDYEPPRVERLWRQLGGLRINLHRIHPCEEALYHPHPWPSAIRILNGRYEMGIGFSTPLNKSNGAPVTEVAKVFLGPMDQYEMSDAYGWHYVRPLDGPSLSLMVTGGPWGHQVWDHAEFGKTAQLKPLANDTKQKLLDEFTVFFR